MNKLISILKEKKSIPLDQYINIALYDKKFGYYMKNSPFGKDGDFVTAPSVSVLFSEMLAIWFVAYWEHIGKPSKFLIVELGPGDGTLCRNLINTFKQFKNFYKALEINLLEISSKLKKIKIDIVIHAATHYVKKHKENDIKKLGESNIFFGKVILENIQVMKVKKFINFLYVSII